MNLIESVPLDTPDALARKARDIGARLGYTDPPTDTAYGFDDATDYLNYVVKNDPSPARWNRLQFPAVIYYREGPEYIQLISDLKGFWFVPTPHLSGMVFMTLDPQGRLLGFRADPPVTDEAAVSAVDWTALFHAAGLDPARLASAEPR